MKKKLLSCPRSAGFDPSWWKTFLTGKIWSNCGSS